jgi:hypothetical protein
MMSRKDYERAAEIVQNTLKYETGGAFSPAKVLVNGFIDLFLGDNPHFDQARFRAACEPAAPKNVKVTRKTTTLDDIRTAFPGADSKNRRSGKVSL